MKYELIDATSKHIDLVIDFKIKSILENANLGDIEEINRIKKYVINSIPSVIDEYKLIVVNNDTAGCYLVKKYEDGYLLDEIYVVKEYRNKGIGTNILNDIINEYKRVYLWVYSENVMALDLYKRLGFKVISEEKDRIFMGIFLGGK